MIRQTISTMIRRRAGTPHFGDGAAPFFVSGTPFAGHHPCQTSDLATVAIKRPIQDLALELHLTERANSFGPRAVAAAGKSSFGLSNFLIEHLEHIDPDLQPLQQPGR